MAPRVRDPQRAARILREASRLFYERGFHATSVDEIGEAAGATGAAIYRHFASKEEILATLFDEAQDRYLLEIPERREDPFEELDLLVGAHTTLTLEQRELASIWSRESRALSPSYLRRMRRREAQYVGRWVGCLERCFPHRSHDDLVAAARASIGTIGSLATRPDVPAVDDPEVQVVTGIVAAGLRSLAGVPAIT